MIYLVLFIFIIGYLCIAFEHPIKVDKAASAIITGVLCWLVYFLEAETKEAATESLMHVLGDIASIVFFLTGAMVIVELIDSHGGFQIITDKITASKKSTLLVIITIITFFLSALLDNLTTAIVMTSLCSRILAEKEDRLWFAGIIVIAANSGGVWSPLGDVTTTMLWIGGQVTALNIIVKTFLPGIAVCLVPMSIMFMRFRNKQFVRAAAGNNVMVNRSGNIVLVCGIGFLIFVPVFKMVTHMPPFMGMLLALGFMWAITSLIHKDSNHEDRRRYSAMHALQRIDMPSILFFLGILLAVSSLEVFGWLEHLATFLDESLRNNYLIGASLGVLSAVVDNVPLVAAVQGMYDLSHFPTDHPFWEFVALTTGTGGSMIIIGSAAGVAVMAIEKIDFMWYMKKISWLALLGYIAGIAVFIGQEVITGRH